MASLLAFPDVVLVEPTVGHGSTDIYYVADTSGKALVLWERLDQKRWVRVEPPRIFRTPSGNPGEDGVFSQDLKPGHVYQVVAYDTDQIDPNVSDPEAADGPRPLASVRVLAILKGREATDLLVPHDQSAGGTWFRKGVTTRVPTFCVLQVSRAPAFPAKDGPRFLVPLATVFHERATQHDRTVEPLLPGNDLHYLMRVVDDQGNWQTVSGPFRTKRRKVTIHFDTLHIINDGAEGDTTAEFRIWVMEGMTSVRSFFFGNVDNFPISDRPSPGNETMEWIPLAPHCPPYTLGPKDVTDQTYEVGLLTRGLIYRTVVPNEKSRNFTRIGDPFPDAVPMSPPRKALFPFPTGYQESVQNTPFVVRTIPEGDVEFQYDVKVLVSVEYL